MHATGFGLVVWISLAWTFDATDWSRRTHLTLVGATLELIGVALVAMDFWRPWLTQAGRRARKRLDAALHGIHVYLESLRGRNTRGVEDDGISPEAVDEIIRERRRTTNYTPVRKALVEHGLRLEALEEHQRTGFTELQERIDKIGDVVDKIIEQDRMRYIGWRVLGLIVAFAGTLLLTAANLVS